MSCCVQEEEVDDGAVLSVDIRPPSCLEDVIEILREVVANSIDITS